MPETTLQKRRFPFLPFMPSFARELDDDRMRRLFGEPFLSERDMYPLGWYPPVEVVENKDEFILTAELPGIKEKDVELTFEKGVLLLKGEKMEERKEEEPDKKHHLWERSYGTFQRSFTFPYSVDEKKIAAEFKDGILTVRLPKTIEEKTRGQKIAIVAK